jgi:DNA-binding transcriptional ArsR family regulator
MKNTQANKSADYYRVERIVKGFANHRRLQILDLLRKEPELTLEQIAERINAGYMNASDHVRRMAIAGLVLKRQDGLYIRHKLTTRAETILAFCKKLY